MLHLIMHIYIPPLKACGVSRYRLCDCLFELASLLASACVKWSSSLLPDLDVTAGGLDTDSQSYDNVRSEVAAPVY